MQSAAGNFFRFRTEAVAGAALFCLLLFATLAPLFTAPSGAGSQNSGEAGNALRQAVYLLIFGTSIACARIENFAQRFAAIPLSILLTLAWCVLSMTWALNAGIGVRRLFLTYIVIVSIFLLVGRVGYQRATTIVRLVLVLVLIANFAAVLVAPDWAIHQAATEEDPSIVGAWRGILLQKNFAGAACALTILFFFFDSEAVRLSVKLPVMALAAFFLYQSESKTSAALLVFCIVVATLLLRYSAYYRVWLAGALIAAAACAALLAVHYWAALAAPFASGDALTGRVQIWPPLFQYWRDHWLLGSGFGSFWNIGDPEPISSYAEGWVSQITSGHNGFLDLLVQIGLPGLVLAVIAFFAVPMRQLLTSGALDRSRRSLLAAVILFGVGHNFTESSLLDRDAAVYVFLTFAIALLNLEARGPADTAARPDHNSDFSSSS
jgi:O-antigen ligase